DFWGATHAQTPLNRFGMESRATTRPGAKIISLSAIELNHKSNYQDFGRYVEADLAITSDAEATLPALIEAVKKLMTGDRRRVMQERGAKIAEAGRQWRQRHRETAGVGWDASPISTARLSAELWAQVKNEDWSLVSFDRMQSSWPTRLWDFKKHYQYIGAQGGAGIDYASIAKGYGLYAEGPITEPKDLAGAIKRGIERVKAGEPALIDVVTQPR